nr:MAG TPA: hypothetical protein [Caudoviricetes sp.]
MIVFITHIKYKKGRAKINSTINLVKINFLCDKI